MTCIFLVYIIFTLFKLCFCWRWLSVSRITQKLLGQFSTNVVEGCIAGAREETITCGADPCSIAEKCFYVRPCRSALSECPTVNRMTQKLAAPQRNSWWRLIVKAVMTPPVLQNNTDHVETLWKNSSDFPKKDSSLAYWHNSTAWTVLIEVEQNIQSTCLKSSWVLLSMDTVYQK